jgi:hypothetical protein
MFLHAVRHTRTRSDWRSPALRRDGTVDGLYRAALMSFSCNADPSTERSPLWSWFSGIGEHESKEYSNYVGLNRSYRVRVTSLEVL